MKTLKEITQNPNFATLPYTAYNLQLYKKGTHEADFISSLGRCFAETPSKRKIGARVEVGTSDVLWLFNYIGFHYQSKYKKNKPEMTFKYSNSGASLYIQDMTTELYDAIVEALQKYPKNN